MFNIQGQRGKQAGFTLIETLVALVVMGFGLLSIAGMQLHLSRNADIAKQRTEATRLAQERIETLRSFTGIDTGTINWNGLASGSEIITPATYLSDTANATNVSYTRTWTLTGTTTQSMRPAFVAVNWVDRAGEAQTVTLATVISKTKPSDSGYLNFPLPQNTTLKRPLNRNINVPVPALNLGGGKSALKLSANLTLIFSDVSGGVVQKCTGNTDVTAVNYAQGAGNGSMGGLDCASFTAFILAGYVSGSLTTNAVSGNPNAPIPNDIPTMPTGINTSGITGWDDSGGKTISCVYRVASDQVSPFAEIPSFHYYLCVIPVTASGANSTWGGTVRLGGVLTTSTNKVCRFEYAASSFASPNMRNVQPYISVSDSLDNQNYYIDSSGTTCDTLTSAGGSLANGGSVVTTLHQNCRSDASPTTTNTGTCPLTTYNTGP